MDIFVSWSGQRSKACAEALSSWLPKVINAIRPWMSANDIDKGSRWQAEVSTKLAEAKFGIVCLTPENLHSDWILFEAGALSKALNQGRTFTFLVGLSATDVEYPLAQFQHTVASKPEMLSLLRTINKHAEGQPLSEQHLGEALDVWWPKLEAQIEALPVPSVTSKPQRPDRELIEEILDLLRNQNRRNEQRPNPAIERRNQNLARDIAAYCKTNTTNIAFDHYTLAGAGHLFVFKSNRGERYGDTIDQYSSYENGMKRLKTFVDGISKESAHEPDKSLGGAQMQDLEEWLRS